MQHQQSLSGNEPEGLKQTYEAILSELTRSQGFNH
jgi:hypothetical protein